jgi:phospholipase C
LELVLARPQRAARAPPGSATAHIVILMQENRSSDGSFDTYPSLRGFDDRLERT